MAKVSIKEVAKIAGVSKTTVSHSLSGKRHVSEETKKRINEVIDKLQYYPNSIAQSLVSKKTGIIGMAYPAPLIDSNHRENVEFIFNAVNKINELGYKFLLITGNYNDELSQIKDVIRSGHVDGLVLMDIRLNDSRVNYLKSENFPFVMIGRTNNNTGLHFVDIDAEDALFEGTNFLLSKNKKNILFMAIEPVDFGFTQKCINGYKNALKSNGIPFDKNLICLCESDENYAYNMMKIIVKKKKFDAVITGCDVIGAGVIRAIKSENIKIPDDISVLTFGNSSLCTITSPALTALSLRYKDMSDIAIETLIKLLSENNFAQYHTILKSNLVIRESS